MCVPVSGSCSGTFFFQLATISNSVLASERASSSSDDVETGTRSLFLLVCCKYKIQYKIQVSNLLDSVPSHLNDSHSHIFYRVQEGRIHFS